MDVLCMPSNPGEGFPIALLEAAALGKPVVCCNSGGIGEVVCDGKTGRLVDCGDLEGFTEALRTVLMSSDERARLGRELRALVRGSHDMESTHPKYTGVYKAVMAANCGREHT